MRSKGIQLGGAIRGLSMALAVGVAFPAAAATQAQALELRAVPKKGFASNLRGDIQVSRIVIKFREGTHVRLRGSSLSVEAGARSAQERSRLSQLKLDDAQLASDLDAVHKYVSRESRAGRLARLFSVDEQTLMSKKAEAELRSGRELADLNLYMEVPVAAGSTFADVAQLVAALDALPSVETAYAEPPAEPASVPWSSMLTALQGATDLAPVTPQFDGEQGYLQAAPLGVDAVYAWTVNGGTGAGVKIVDVEGAWRTSHEDLPAFFHTGGTQFADLGWRNHGTAVVGVMVGVKNAYGVTGVAHGAQIGFEAIGAQSVASAITNAANAAGVGGVVLIEVHRLGPPNSTPCTCNTQQCDYIAMEYWQAEYDAISLATLSGVTVVEASGNGSSNLDDAAYGGAFDRSSRDSGAILVGAGSSAGRAPMCWTNFGSRVDVHGWGEQVITSGYGDRFNPGDENQFYTAVFNGTSSASPIITGSVASIQGALKANGRNPLSPLAIRDVLVSTGTAQAPDAKQIGPRPDLRRALGKLNLRP
ncbi:S8 family peptidase [Cystobacter fuscus]|uniref:S8 family peptidase n=1 Tax=Cystobacter fuscus TaxID=43 RepID=UPI002B2B2409|nr:S8 family serine peptidase [Cystobacter fuscus]